MSYRVVFLEEAERDMNGIEEYLSQFYPSTARNFFAQLKKKLSLLEEQPFMYQVYEDDPYFRRMVVDDYLLFYNIDENRKLAIVHRIFHSSRDISRQILKHRSESSYMSATSSS